MKIIHNKKEFEDNHRYRDYCVMNGGFTKSNGITYPKRYPCIVEHINRNVGGLAGEWTDHVITYFPKDVDQDSFLKGYIAGRNIRD